VNNSPAPRVHSFSETDEFRKAERRPKAEVTGVTNWHRRLGPLLQWLFHQWSRPTVQSWIGLSTERTDCAHSEGRHETIWRASCDSTRAFYAKCYSVRCRYPCRCRWSCRCHLPDFGRPRQSCERVKVFCAFVVRCDFGLPLLLHSQLRAQFKVIIKLFVVLQKTRTWL